MATAKSFSVTRKCKKNDNCKAFYVTRKRNDLTIILDEKNLQLHFEVTLCTSEVFLSLTYIVEAI